MSTYVAGVPAVAAIDSPSAGMTVRSSAPAMKSSGRDARAPMASAGTTVAGSVPDITWYRNMAYATPGAGMCQVARNSFSSVSGRSANAESSTSASMSGVRAAASMAAAVPMLKPMTATWRAPWARAAATAPRTSSCSRAPNDRVSPSLVPWARMSKARTSNPSATRATARGRLIPPTRRLLSMPGAITTVRPVGCAAGMYQPRRIVPSSGLAKETSS